MQYTPSDFDPSINVSSRKPFSEFFQYLVGICVVFIVGYFILGLLVDWSLKYVSQKQEEWMWEKLQISGLAPLAAKGAKFDVQKLVDRIPQEMLSFPVKLKIRIVDEDIINAFAVPGGTIVITAGLLKRMQSENGLMFILGHELGHFMARDQIRQLGRGLVVMTLSSLAFGDDSSVSNFMANVFMPIRNKFSQHQETAADEWGLKIIANVYGHVGGATEFFKTVLKEREENQFLDAFSTHPLSSDRILHIEELKKELAVKDGEVVATPRLLE
jgi:Zn-dependent protease with chaperone function